MCVSGPACSTLGVMADQLRARRLAQRIKVIVAQTLKNRVKDPRLGFVTVTDVRVTGDLQHATVFYTVLGDDQQLADTQAALESARGLVRSEVGKGTGIRLTPTITFTADALPQAAASIDEALRRAAQADAEVARQARHASYAGEADPYRKPASEDEDERD